MSYCPQCAETEKKLDTTLSVVETLRDDVARYWPFVEMVAHNRQPTMQDSLDAMEMLREKQQQAMFQREQDVEQAALRG